MTFGMTLLTLACLPRWTCFTVLQMHVCSIGQGLCCSQHSSLAVCAFILRLVGCCRGPACMTPKVATFWHPLLRIDLNMDSC